MKSIESKKIPPMVARDVSWMYFNHRILQEAQRSTVPLLERLNFLGIYSSNLDEFFRVRVATLNRIVEADDGKTLKKVREQARHTLRQIARLNASYSAEFSDTMQTVSQLLRDEHILILFDTEVDDAQKDFVRNYYRSHLNGTIQPVWLSAISNLADEADDSIYLAIRLTQWHSYRKRPVRDCAIVRIPRALDRFVRLPDRDGCCCIMYLDDVICICMPLVFVGQDFSQFEAYAFKFTKDAEMEIDNDPECGKLQKVQRGVRSRKRGEPMRVIYDGRMPRDLLKKVMKHLGVNHQDTASAGGRYQNHRDLMSFPDCGRSDLRYAPMPPVRSADFDTDGSLLGTIARRDLFLHVPYQSFDGYIRFLREAAISPSVRSVKTTLYRLARDSRVVSALITAAKNGKKVTVVIELFARFDESSNIKWSERMQDAGIEVIFGVDGLKVHSKITLVETATCRLACIGTGNFHEGNARLYTDCMLFTSARAITKDVANFFDFIRTPYLQPKFKELMVSPVNMRERLAELIDNEVRNARRGVEAYIMVKTNHVTDVDIIRRLNAAREAGVRVGMMVRGNYSMMCADGVRGIIDRYLEHARILIFANGGDEKFFMGSADWMPRNLDNRIEVMTPVYDPAIRAELKMTVEYGLRDNCQARVVDGLGRNEIYTGNPDEVFRSQTELYRHYAESAQPSDKH